MEARELKDKASAFFTKGRFAKAAEMYEEFCVLDKKDHQARLRCGDAWSKAGKKDKAIIAYSLAAEGYARDGFLPRAIAASKLVLEIDPAHKGVQKMLADLYAQKSAGPGRAKSSSPSAIAAPQEMEVTRSVSAPVTSTFANNKAAIDLDAPLVQPRKTGYRPMPVEAPSPMNRADALELPEYEIPMDDGPSSLMAAQLAGKGPTPQRRADAIEIDVEEGPAPGPRALVETTIDIDVSPGHPESAEVEIPIEGQALPDADQLPPERQIGKPLQPPPASQNFELEVSAPKPPPPPPAEVYDLTVEVAPLAAPAPPRASGVYDLTDALPDPKPSVPAFELTVEADPLPPAPPPSVVAPSRVAARAVVATPAEAVRAQVAPPAPHAVPAAPPPGAPEDAVPLHVASPLPEVVRPVVAPALAAEKVVPRAAPPAAKSSALPPAVGDRASAPPAISPGAAPHAKSSALPPHVGDAASAPPSIRPLASADAAQPPGLKPRRVEASSGLPSSRIWLPPAFTPAAAPRPEDSAVRASPAPTALVAAPAEPSTDLERSLQAFMQFDPDAPAAAAPAPLETAAVDGPASRSPSFTELDLDETDSLLHAVDAATNQPKPVEAVEEAMEAEEDPHAQGGGLPKIPLFSDLPEDAFIALFEKCPLQRFEEGQLVFEQGEKADAFYVICGGKVRVFRSDGGERKDLATLEEGSFFGEMALLSEAPRSASVEAAAEDTQVLVISAEILKELSASYPVVSTALKKFCRQRMLSNLMNQAAIFAPFNRNDRRELVQKFRARDVNKGDVLVKEGASSDGLYVVLSGEVVVEAKGHRIASLKEGQVFGEMSLLMRSPASATVRATRHTSLLRLPKHDFDMLILSHPQVLEHVSSLIDERKKSDLSRKKNDAAELV